ncbi:MAG: hypothetical protein ABIQ55_03825 [Gemmatimonadaceae bacterium]
MNASPATNRNTAADRTAAQLGRIVILGAAVVEVVVIGIALFSRYGAGVR